MAHAIFSNREYDAELENVKRQLIKNIYVLMGCHRSSTVATICLKKHNENKTRLNPKVAYCVFEIVQRQ